MARGARNEGKGRGYVRGAGEIAAENTAVKWRRCGGALRPSYTSVQTKLWVRKDARTIEIGGQAFLFMSAPPSGTPARLLLTPSLLQVPPPPPLFRFKSKSPPPFPYSNSRGTPGFPVHIESPPPYFTIQNE